MNFEPYDRFNDLVDDIVAGHSPAPESCHSEEELKMLQVGVLLRTATSANSGPPTTFSQKLRGELEPLPPAKEPEGKRMSRRHLLGTIAASVATGGVAAFTLERLYEGSFRSQPEPQVAIASTATHLATPVTRAEIEERLESGSEYNPNPTDPVSGLPELDITKNGQWFMVTAAREVEPGDAFSFTTGAVSGFLLWQNNQIIGISAICTHMGCQLRWNKTGQDLTCPCHGATFDINGALKSGPASYKNTLPPLPRLTIKVEPDGQVYVWAV